MQINDWKSGIDYPEWMSSVGLSTLSRGYLLETETPKLMFQRVAKAAAARLDRPDLEEKFFQYMWNGWLCLATPVAANMGTDRGLPISCFGGTVGDSIINIAESNREIMVMSKFGGGTSLNYSNVRARGTEISGGGVSEGVVPWCKINDSTIIAVSQGATRRGALAVYLRDDHKDFDDFLRIRDAKGDMNKQCLNLNFGVSLGDDFMNKVKSGDPLARKHWLTICQNRMESGGRGQPYLFFRDNVNKANPEMYQQKGFEVPSSNLCTEIMLFSDKDHSFVCCLSSLNLARWDEWKDTDLVETSIYFLDAVMEEFIVKAELIEGMEKAVKFAKKSRALGLGVLGWHTLLQKKGLPFDTSWDTMTLNAEIFRTIYHKATHASEDLAKEYGEPEWCTGFKRRNTHLLAIAPTVSNAKISEASPGIEPISANYFADKTAKGTFIYKNSELVKLLESKNKNTPEVWKSINQRKGSVQHLPFLTNEEKAVFLTAREINQFHLVVQAAQRQKFIDQGQSLNLFFPANVDADYFTQVHFKAWELGLKTLYYCRSGSAIDGDIASRHYEPDCISCDG